MSNPIENIMQDDLHHIMDTYQGRRFIWELLGITGVGQGSGMVIGATDATAFNLGKIDVGLAIQGMFEPEQFFKMTKEAKEREQNDRPNTINPDDT